MGAFKDSNNSLTKDHNKTFNTQNTRTEFDSKYPLSIKYVLIIPVQYCSNKLSCSARGFRTFCLCTVVQKLFNSNCIQCILYHFLFLLSMIQYRYLCRIFERKCSFDHVFSLFEVDKVNAKYVSRVTISRFFVNYVTHTSQSDKNRMR